MRAWWLAGVMVIGAGCDGGAAPDDRVDAILALTGDPVAGEAHWEAECSGCHSNASQFAVVPEANQVQVVLDGTGGMPPQDGLADQVIADIVAYVIAQ